MDPAAVLSVLVTANTAQANAALGRTSAQLKSTGAAAGAAATKVNAALRTTSMIGVGIALVAGKMAADFEDAMSQIETQAGAPQGEIEKLRGKVIELAKASEFSPTQLAEGLYRVESAGFRGAKAMEVLKNASDLADVGHSNLEATTYALTAVLNSGIKGAENMAETVGVLNAAVGQGNMRMEDLVGAMSTGVLPAARAFGLGLMDVTAALDVMTRAGTPAQAAATRLRMTFSLLGAPTDQAQQALKGIGIDSTELAEAMRGPRGLLGALEILKEHLDKLPKVEQAAVLSRAFGGGRSSSAIQSLVQNIGTYKDILNATEKQSGLFSRAIAKDNETTASKVAAAWASIQADMVIIGANVLPVIASLSDALSTATGIFSSLPSPIGEVTLALAVLAWPIGKVVGGIIKLAAAWRVLAAAQAAGAAASGAQLALFGGGAAGGMAGLAAAAGPAALAIVAAAGAFALYSTRASDAAMQTENMEEHYQGTVDALIDQSEKLNSAQLQRTREWVMGLAEQGKVSGQWAVDQVNALDKATKAHRTYQDVVVQIQAVGSGPLEKYGDDVVKLTDRVITEIGDVKKAVVSLPERVGTGFTALVGMWDSKFRKMAGITKLQMANVIQAMQKGPDAGRRAMVKVFDKMIDNIQAKMKSSAVTVAQGMAAIRKIVLKELALFGIEGPGTWKAVTGPGPIAFGIPGPPPKVAKPQTGAMIVPGHGTGDSVPVHALVEPGEALAVLNRNAAAKWMGWNSEYPRHRHQKGGLSIPRAYGTAPGVLDDLAAAQVNLVGSAAEKWFKKKMLSGPAGVMRHYPMLSGDTDFQPRLGMALSRMAKATGQAISVTSGFRSVAEQAALFRANPNPRMVAPPGRSNHGRGIAADISPGRAVFGGAVSRYGLHFPMSWEPWHVELIRAQRGGMIRPRRGAHWIKGSDPQSARGRLWSADEAATLLWQWGLSEHDAGILSRVLPGESGGDPRARNASSGAAGLFQILGRAAGGPPGNLMNPIINAGHAVIKYNERGLAPWEADPSGPTGKVIRTLTAGTRAMRRRQKIEAVAGFNVNDLPISMDAKRSLWRALASQARLIGKADAAAEFADRAADIEGLIGGKDQATWLKQELKAVWTLRNRLVVAHNIMVRSIERINEQIAKVPKGKGRKRLKETRDLVNGKLSEVGETLFDIQGNVIGYDPFKAMINLPAAGPFGGRIFEIQASLKDVLEDTTTVDDSPGLTAEDLRNLTALKNLGVVFNPGQFAGMFARGGVLGAGQWGIAGERGPEPVVGPARIVPNGGAEVRVVLEDRRTAVYQDNNLIREVFHEEMAERDRTEARANRAGIR